MLATGQKPPRLALYRNFLLLVLALAVLVTLALLLTRTSVRQFPVRVRVGGAVTQTGGSCWLVSEMEGGELAAASTNRIALIHTSRCAYCSQPRSLPGSTRYRVSLFVDPCPLASFLS